MRFDLRGTDHRLPIVKLFEDISGALEARDAAAFEKLLEDHSYLRAGRAELLNESTAQHHMSLVNVAVPMRQLSLQSAAGGGGGGAMSPAGPFAAPQQQQQPIQQSHLTNGRQMLIALPQQNGSPPLATSVVSSISRPGGLPNPFLNPTQETQDSAVRLDPQ